MKQLHQMTKGNFSLIPMRKKKKKNLYIYKWTIILIQKRENLGDSDGMGYQIP